MENKNTFSFNSDIILDGKLVDIFPCDGDQFVFCGCEDSALEKYKAYIEELTMDEDFEIPVEEIYLTDFFKKQEIHGVLCSPIYIGDQKFGFFGCRENVASWIRDGRFFLYKMD